MTPNYWRTVLPDADAVRGAYASHAAKPSIANAANRTRLAQAYGACLLLDTWEALPTFELPHPDGYTTPVDTVMYNITLRQLDMTLRVCSFVRYSGAAVESIDFHLYSHHQPQNLLVNRETRQVSTPEGTDAVRALAVWDALSHSAELCLPNLAAAELAEIALGLRPNDGHTPFLSVLGSLTRSIKHARSLAANIHRDPT